jgi:hypothetical protein
MMQGPIRKTVLHRVEQRGDVRLPSAWISKTAEPSAWRDGGWLTRTPSPLAGPAETPVLAFLGKDWSEDHAQLIAHAGAAVRVYALVGPDWGKNHDDHQLLQVPRVLVRRIPEVPASAILIGSEARLWIGGGFILRLDADQAEALRQNFLRLFWHEASEEAWADGQQFAWCPARDRPFDIPLLPSTLPVRLDTPEARLSNSTNESLLLLNSGPPPDSVPRRLWFPAGPNHHQRLAQLEQAGVEVQWRDSGLPDILIASDGGEVLLPGTRGRLRIRLTDKQAGEVSQLLEAPPAWRFHTNIPLGETSHRFANFWLPGEEDARELESEQLVEVPEVHAASLRGMADAAPTSVPDAQPLALAVRFQWTVLPPRVPTGAQEDPLIARWRKLDEDWIARLKRVSEALNNADGERNRIGQAFSRLVSPMLGFERTRSGLLARVRELEARRLSKAGPAEAITLLTQLSEIEDAARKLQANLEDAERKAREDDEREKQQAAWQSQVNAAKQKLPDCQTKLTAAKSRSRSTADDLRDIEESLKSADKEAGKDLKAKKLKLTDERQRHDKEVKRLQGEISTLEKQAAEQFVFRPPQSPATVRPVQSSGRFVPQSSSAPAATNVPNESLPETGDLRTHKGQRYLVIQTWEQLEAGESSASRLSAKLVAPENA